MQERDNGSVLSLYGPCASYIRPRDETWTAKGGCAPRTQKQLLYKMHACESRAMRAQG